MDHFVGRGGASDEITFLLCRVAPGTARIPVPGLDHELSVLAIGDGLSAGTEDLLQQRIGEQLIGSSRSQPVNGRAQRVRRTECVHHMRGSGVDHHFLSGCRIRPPERSSDDKKCCQTATACFPDQGSFLSLPWTWPQAR